MDKTPTLIKADWPAPATVAAFCTTRIGGVSEGVFDSFNIGDHVSDDPAAVAANREALIEACPGLSAVSWLQQVHGTAVAAATVGRHPQADAQYTRTFGLGCAVMTADCLPVLLCNRDGSQVAAVHAGWRGLCAGVIEQTVAAFAPGQSLLAWLGPAIGPDQFEVGPEVRAAFLDEVGNIGADREATAACFRPSA
ncbi:MAG: laccase domain-containing protein, partial [Spongiibacteraceae bacterium]